MCSPGWITPVTPTLCSPCVVLYLSDCAIDIMTLCASVAFHKVFEVGFSKATRKVRKLENSLKPWTRKEKRFSLFVRCLSSLPLACAVHKQGIVWDSDCVSASTAERTTHIDTQRLDSGRAIIRPGLTPPHTPTQPIVPNIWLKLNCAAVRGDKTAYRATSNHRRTTTDTDGDLAAPSSCCAFRSARFRQQLICQRAAITR